MYPPASFMAGRRVHDLRTYSNCNLGLDGGHLSYGAVLAGEGAAGDQADAAALGTAGAVVHIQGIVGGVVDQRDLVGVLAVEFFVAGASVGFDSDSSDGYGVTWDSTSVVDGTYQITAVATDDALQTSSASIVVSVDNIDSLPVADAGPQDARRRALAARISSAQAPGAVLPREHLRARQVPVPVLRAKAPDRGAHLRPRPAPLTRR